MKMKGVVLAGGSGTRLRPMTVVTNKQLLHVYDRPLVYCPVLTLRDAGIKDILVISGPEHRGQLFELMGQGDDLGVRLAYATQKEPKGLAHGLSLAEGFAEGHRVAMILGDNIFQEHRVLAIAVKEFLHQEKGAKIILKQTETPYRFGVVEFNKKGELNRVIEKPENPPSNWMVTGFYLYDKKVFNLIKTLKPSQRGELEITDLNNIYIQGGEMTYKKIYGRWIDAGTVDSLLEANNFVAEQIKGGEWSSFAPNK